MGSTTRSFKARRLEHQGRSIHTSRSLTKPEFSLIRAHSDSTGHPFKITDFPILLVTLEMQLNIIKSIIIKKDKPTLNSYVTTTQSYTFM